MNSDNTIKDLLAANVKAAAARKAAVKEVRPNQPGECRELGCTEPALPDQSYCSKHTLVGRVPELGDEPRPKAGASTSDMTCVTCGKDVKDCFRVNGKPTPMCFSCWRKTDDGKSKNKPPATKRQKQPKP